MSAKHLRGARVAPFNFEDFKFVGSKVSNDPARLILVGGQALSTWGVLLDVRAPEGEGAGPLTEDTDWLGGKLDAKWLCDQLGPSVDLQLAGDFDPSPNSAIARIQRPDGRVLLMDFLRAIIGPDEATVRDLAVEVRVENIRLNVLHPLLCLESRLANIEHLRSKRNTNGIAQAHWAIAIAGAFIDRVIQECAPTGDMRPAIEACHSVAENAEYKSGRYCFLEYGLDPLIAVTQERLAAIGGRFVMDDWPRRVQRIAEKRARWRRQREQFLARRVAKPSR